ncbi:MAG: hypothetical protein PHY92_05695 [Alphaproteobacteria bacterium]|nr:hypothetical protein [Alphaproteobacteria bacterium]
MSIWGQIIGIVFLLATGYLIGHHMASTSGTNGPIVTMKFANASGKSIKTIHLEHDEGLIDLHLIPDGGSKIVRFYAPQETSYKVEVTFDDDNFLETPKRYIERGQHVIEKIEELKITPDFKAPLE